MNQIAPSSRASTWIPSRRWLVLPPVLLGATVIVWLVSEKQELPRKKQTPRSIPVHVLRTTRTDVHPEVTGFGTARAMRTWTAIAEVGGRVAELHPDLDDGMFVKADEALVRVDAVDYDIRREQRQADLAQAESQLEQTRLQADADKESLAIQRKLLTVRTNDVRRSEKMLQGVAASPAELDAAKAVLLQQTQSVQSLQSSLATYESQIRSAKAKVASAKASLRTAERDIERTRIASPFPGILTGVDLESSQYLSTGQQLFQVMDVSSIEIQAQFSIAQLRELTNSSTFPREGDEPCDWSHDELVSLSTECERCPSDRQSWNGWISELEAMVTVRSGEWQASYPARVQRTVGRIDEKTRMLGVVVRVDNSNENARRFPLNPGTFCEVALRPAKPKQVFVVPRDSVKSDSVFVIDETNHLRQRSVAVAFTRGEMAAIGGGLLENELVVVHPPASVRAGVLVEPHPVNTDNWDALRGSSIKWTSPKRENRPDSLQEFVRGGS